MAAPGVAAACLLRGQRVRRRAARKSIAAPTTISNCHFNSIELCTANSRWRATAIDLPADRRLTAQHTHGRDRERRPRNWCSRCSRATSARSRRSSRRTSRASTASRCRASNRNADAAKDVVQATLIKAMRKLGDCRGEAALFTWLCQICRRADRRPRALRSVGTPTKVVLIEDSDEVRAALESIEAPATDDPLHGAAIAPNSKRLVHAVLDRLPSRYGEALEWKYVEGRSVEEIGDRLGIGHTAAQSLLARARVRVPGRARGRVRRVGGRRARQPRGVRAER
ncbi:MAG: RNA polymerase sigma factor [Ignavibacteriales bacterium]|nr:RNA polymerase sigma factor [Ignavibacteriales bacterium]